MTQPNNIDARTLKDLLERGERVTVVDVHEEGSIPGSMTVHSLRRSVPNIGTD